MNPTKIYPSFFLWVWHFKHTVSWLNTFTYAVPLNLTKILHRWWKEKDKFDYRNPNACSGCGHYIQVHVRFSV